MKPFEDIQRFTFSAINKYKQTVKRSRPDDFENDQNNRYE